MGTIVSCSQRKRSARMANSLAILSLDVQNSLSPSPFILATKGRARKMAMQPSTKVMKEMLTLHSTENAFQGSCLTFSLRTK